MEAAWGIGGLLIGAAAGSLVTWAMLRRSIGSAGQPEAPPAPAGRPAEPVQDSEVRSVIDANRRALEELEGRYRGRRPPKGKGE